MASIFVISMIIMVLLILSFSFFIIKSSKKQGKYMTDEYIPEKKYGFSIQERYFTLEAVSMKPMILPLIVAFITISVLFGIIIVVETEVPVLSDIGKEIMDDYMVWFFEFIFIQMAFFILYALHKRVKITSENGKIYINEVMEDIKYYQIKEIFGENTLLYLKSERKLWILLPTTVEGLRKYPRKDILREQTKELNDNIVKIKKILSNSDAEERKFSIVRNLLLGTGGIFILLTVVIFGMLISKYYWK